MVTLHLQDVVKNRSSLIYSSLKTQSIQKTIYLKQEDRLKQVVKLIDHLCLQMMKMALDKG